MSRKAPLPYFLKRKMASQRDLERLVDELARDAVNSMLNNIELMRLYDDGKLFTFLRYKLHYRFDTLERVSFRMPVHGIMAEHGVYGGKKKALGGQTLAPRPWFTNYWENGGHDVWADRISKVVADINESNLLRGIDEIRVSLNLNN